MSTRTRLTWRYSPIPPMACVFCGKQGPLSKEDAIPRWALRALGTLGRIVTRQAVDSRFMRSKTGVAVKFPEVCESCNTGWMSGLEKDVGPWLAPTLVGQQSVFAVPQQQAIAFWAVETATILEAAMRTGRIGPPIPTAIWAWLYEHRKDRLPPPGAHVWFGKYDPWNSAQGRGAIPGHEHATCVPSLRRPRPQRPSLAAPVLPHVHHRLSRHPGLRSDLWCQWAWRRWFASGHHDPADANRTTAGQDLVEAG